MCVQYLSLGLFLSVSIVLLARATVCIVPFCAICVFCLLVVLVRLSVPVQVIGMERLFFVSEMTCNVLTGTLNRTRLLMDFKLLGLVCNSVIQLTTLVIPCVCKVQTLSR